MIYIPGFCCNCGAQTWVKNFGGGFCSLVLGAKEIKLVTWREDKECYLMGLYLCAGCDPEKVDPKVILEGVLHPDSTSGVSEWPPYDLFKTLKIEVVKVMKVR